MLQNEYVLARIGADTADNGPDVANRFWYNLAKFALWRYSRTDGAPGMPQTGAWGAGAPPAAPSDAQLAPPGGTAPAAPTPQAAWKLGATCL